MEIYFRKSFKYLILAALMYMPIFGFLDTLPIRIWDEARLALNSYEMYKNGDYLVTHAYGHPDMWNTKPPLLIWLQVFFMKIVGVNELAVRLPSAIAAFFTSIALLVFSVKYLKNFWFGFIAVFVLITSQGYIGVHAARTGDYDALLALFTTLSGLLFFIFCEKQKPKYLYLFFLFTALAVLTKSISGLLFMPALLLYSLYQKQFLSILKNKHFYIGLLSFLVIVAAYYLLREVNNPGYIAAVQKNELGGRYLNVIDEHQHGFWFYIDKFIDYRLSAWYLLVPPGILIGLYTKNERIRKVSLFSFLMVLTYLLVISTAQTKLRWYDVPLYPYLALLIAVFIHYIFDLLQNFKPINKSLSVNITSYIFLFLIGIAPYREIIDKTFKPKEYIWDRDIYEIEYYLKDAVKGKYNLDNQYLLYRGYKVQNIFYLNILNDKGVKISFKDWKNLNSGDVAIACQDNIKNYVEEHYDFEVINKVGKVLTYKINGKKKQEN